MGVMSRVAVRAPALLAAILAAAAAVAGYAIRNRVIEPEVMGEMCKSADAAFWCPARSAVIVASQWGLIGWLPAVLAVAALILLARWARPAALGAAALAGLALALYNAGLAVPALALSVLILLRLDNDAP